MGSRLQALRRLATDLIHHPDKPDGVWTPSLFLVPPSPRTRLRQANSTPLRIPWRIHGTSAVRPHPARPDGERDRRLEKSTGIRGKPHPPRVDGESDPRSVHQVGRGFEST